MTGGLETIPLPLMKHWQAVHLTYCVSIWDTYSVFFGDSEQMAVELFGGKKQQWPKKKKKNFGSSEELLMKSQLLGEVSICAQLVFHVEMNQK